MKLNRNPAALALACIGILILAGALLPLNIPFGKILITLAVAWAAFSLTTGENRGFRGICEDRTNGTARTVNCVFSGTTVDLTDSGALPEKVVLNAAFSGVTVRLPVDVAAVLHVSCALGSVSVPGHQKIVLGDSTVECGSRDPNAPRLFINASCALGSVSFELG